MRIFGVQFVQSRRQQLFKGTIEERLAGVFDAGIDYTGKSILDAGCNIGMIAYEISKHRPASIHGIDRYRPAVETARRIFKGVATPSRFDVVNLANASALRKSLSPGYDVILLLSVWQYVRREHGAARAAELVHGLTDRCREVLLARNVPEDEAEFDVLMQSHDFSLAGFGATTCNGNRVSVYRSPHQFEVG